MGFSDELISHYTTAKHIDDILEKGRLKLSCFSNVNDPQEAKAWTTSHDRLNNLDRTTYSDKFWHELKNSIVNNYRLLCFCNHDETEIDLIKKIPSWSHPALWAHYADNHSGMCLVFDKSSFLDNIKENHHFFAEPIKYKQPIEIFNAFDKIADKDISSADEFIEKYKDKIFFEKVLDWEKETEFRVVVKTMSDGDCYINFDERSLHSIVLGCNFPYEEHYKDIELYKAKYNFEIFGEYYAQGMLAITKNKDIWLKCKDTK